MLKEKTIENDLEYLRQVSKPVDFKRDNVKKIVRELKKFCTNHSLSMALAAVQLGIPPVSYTLLTLPT
ncbi:MAG: peptide deformylase, partial [Bacilli bacterium]|nr:peptide deformylase [Bacilli bacterium]